MTEHASPDAIRDVYERAAEGWDRQRSRRLFERVWLERFSALVPPGAPVLDLGCGAGEPIGRWLIERGFRLTGVDLAEAMLSICRRRWPDGEWIRADRSGAMRRSRRRWPTSGRGRARIPASEASAGRRSRRRPGSRPPSSGRRWGTARSASGDGGAGAGLSGLVRALHLLSHDNGQRRVPDFYATKIT